MTACWDVLYVPVCCSRCSVREVSTHSTFVFYRYARLFCDLISSLPSFLFDRHTSYLQRAACARNVKRNVQRHTRRYDVNMRVLMAHAVNTTAVAAPHVTAAANALEPTSLSPPPSPPPQSHTSLVLAVVVGPRNKCLVPPTELQRRRLYICHTHLSKFISALSHLETTIRLGSLKPKSHCSIMLHI